MVSSTPTRQLMTLKTVTVHKQAPQQQEVKVQVKAHPFFTAALATANSQVHSPDNSPWGKGSWNPLDESPNRSGHTTGEEKKPCNTCSCGNSEGVWGEVIWLHTLTSAAGGGEWLASRFDSFNPNSTCATGGCESPHGQYGRFGEDKIPFPCRESKHDSSVVNLISIVHYTNWPTRQLEETYAYMPPAIFSFNKNHERTKILQDFRLAGPKVAFEQLPLLLCIPLVVRWHIGLGTNHTDEDFFTIVRPSKCHDSASN